MSVLDDGPDESPSISYLDGEGLPTETPIDVDDETLLGVYKHMRLARRFDERALSWQRQGRIATYAPMRGQEAAQVASAYALDREDWLFPTYRDHIAKVVHGMELSQLLTTLRGVGDGYAVSEGVNVMPEYIPIATQLPHAVGMGMASNYRDDDRVVLAYHGDGATSEGDFHEGLNFAGVFDAPVVFFCNNNQWAISVPRERQTAAPTIAQKAQAYGFEGVRVDGTDPIAVYAATRDAVEKARNPGPGEARPTLIEAVQYRLGAHTTADDPSVYRDGVPEEWAEKDPLPRFETFLRETGRLDDELDDAIRGWAETEVAEAIEAAETATDSPADLFEHMYDELPAAQQEQLAELQALVEEYGEDALTRE
ncbi:pyruvate dehydrogenase (acetyl-transferring) E1 component subunit alpha [Halobium salinum]|uniref:Pyruvate dehydrogenase (Acetyl-transferring) E1 component subunit alpha n=1 Tax=Halobium salinum TaxID=1364940 RepID=A0ABD5PAT8_9EURY|nr:pyruvate dehydrogenase (acetyl-transferring) E1 component subunit alpha [Halobium salinum]